MSTFTVEANPDAITGGAEDTDHTVEIPWADKNGCEVIVKVTGSGTVKFNTRGAASESNDEVEVDDSRTFTVYNKTFSFNKSAADGGFSIMLSHFN